MRGGLSSLLAVGFGRGTAALSQPSSLPACTRGAQTGAGKEQSDGERDGNEREGM